MKKFFEKPIFDPRNPSWLEILRYTIIIGAFLLVIVGVILSFVLSRYVDYVDYWSGDIVYAYDIGTFLLYFVGSFASATIYYIAGMVSLNLLYNVQEIRVNTSRNK